MKKAVFLDKDGTLVENVPYNVDPQKIRLAEGVAEGLRKLKEAGYELIVVSNQSGVALGYFEEEALEPVETRLRQIFADAGSSLDGFYYCPHHPEAVVNRYRENCFCRKPRPGLIFKAAREHAIDLSRSWMVGDILNDIEAGRRAECATILIDNGNETIWHLTPYRQPNYKASDFSEAARFILSANGTRIN